MRARNGTPAQHATRGASARGAIVGFVAAAIAIVILVVASAAPLAAQGYALKPAFQSELRGEVAVARHASALVMLGGNVPAGLYVRAGAALGLGLVGGDGNARLAQRADLTARFLLDPFAEQRWGPYVGGGLTARRDGADRAVAGLLLVLGVEGRQNKRWNHAAEVALGEGVRVAVVLRRARQTGR